MINKKLRDELLAMQATDLDTRQELVDSGELFTEDQSYHPKMKMVHEANNKRIKEILEQHGWPGNSVVGENGCYAAWLIIQHAVLDPELQRLGLMLLEKAVGEKEADPFMMALLSDRLLMQDDKPQVYGTQHVIDKDTNQLVPYTIAKPALVDKLRAGIGLEPLSKATKELNEERNESLKLSK